MTSLFLADLSTEELQGLIAEHGNISRAANFLYSNFLVVHANGTNPLSAERLRRTLSNILRLGLAKREDPIRHTYIEQLLDNSNINKDEIGAIQSAKISSWGVHAKDPQTGEIITKHLYSTKLTLVPEIPELPVVNRATVGPIHPIETPRLLRKTKTAFIYSDAQIGYLIDPETHELAEIHDSKAMSIAHQVMRDVQPNEVAIIGDWMDISFASRWAQHAEFDAPNQSIQAAYDHLRMIRASAGSQLEKFTFIEGNHDQRLEKMLLEHNKSAMRIKRAQDTSAWPVLSVPYLLQFESLGITTTGRYPGGDYYMLPDLMLTHAPPRVAEINASVVHGHSHKVSTTPRVAHSSQGRQTYYMYDIGCLCQLGITGDLQRLMVTRVPSDRGRTNWQQGFAVVNIVEGKIPFHSVDLIAVNNHRAIYGGKVYESVELSENVGTKLPNK
jgi:hypothetical protein